MSNTEMKTKRSPISLIISNKQELHAHYMPFIQSGAIFVPTTEQYDMGEVATAHVFVKEIGKKIPVIGKVAWITPNLDQQGIKAGIGIQFAGANAPKIKLFIEKMLGDLANIAPVKTVY